jgi:hypothetical protein
MMKTRRIGPWWLLLSIVTSIGATIAAMDAFWPDWADEPAPPLADAVFGLLLYGALLALLVWIVRRNGSDLRGLLGRAPDPSRLRWALKCGAALSGVSLAAIYAVFLPLSYSCPDFVQWWLLDDSTVLIWTRGESFHLANVINFAVLAVLGPVTEEFLFRGVLLPSFAVSWGEAKAAIASSCLFAAFHLDMLGAFVFGLVCLFTSLSRQTEPGEGLSVDGAA